MKNVRTILAACILAAGLTACGESSTPLAPAGPHYDTGLGSSTTNSGTTSTSTSTTTGDDGRGGPFTAGSGN